MAAWCYAAEPVLDSPVVCHEVLDVDVVLQSNSGETKSNSSLPPPVPTRPLRVLPSSERPLSFPRISRRSVERRDDEFEQSLADIEDIEVDRTRRGSLLLSRVSRLQSVGDYSPVVPLGYDFQSPYTLACNYFATRSPHLLVTEDAINSAMFACHLSINGDDFVCEPMRVVCSLFMLFCVDEFPDFLDFPSVVMLFSELSSFTESIFKFYSRYAELRDLIPHRFVEPLDRFWYSITHGMLVCTDRIVLQAADSKFYFKSAIQALARENDVSSYPPYAGSYLDEVRPLLYCLHLLQPQFCSSYNQRTLTVPLSQFMVSLSNPLTVHEFLELVDLAYNSIDKSFGYHFKTFCRYLADRFLNKEQVLGLRTPSFVDDLDSNKYVVEQSVSQLFGTVVDHTRQAFEDNTRLLLKNVSSVLMSLDVSPLFKDKFCQMVTSSLLSICTLYRDPSPVTLALETGKLLLSYGDSLQKSMKSRLHSLVESYSRTITTQSSELSAALFEFLGLFSIESILSYFGLIGDGYAWFKKFLKDRVSIATLGEKFVSLLQSFVVTVKDCFDTRSLTPLFRRKLTPVQWIVLSEIIRDDRVMLGSYDLKYLDDMKKVHKFIPSDWILMDELTRLSHVEWLVEEAQTFSTYQIDPPTSGALRISFNIALKALTEFESKCKLRVEMTNPRVVPFTVCFKGKPGAGKTTMIPRFAQVIARETGRPYRSENTYTWDPSLNYADGFRSNQDIILMDDFDKCKFPKELSPVDQTYVSFVMKVVNTAPANAEQADVADKGKEYFRPKAVFMTTNNDPSEEEVRKVLTSPAAYFSRINYFVEVETADGKDWRTHPPTDPGWKFQVYKLTSEGSKGTMLCSFDEIGPMLEWYQIEFKSHIDKQLALLTKLAPTDDDFTCAKCGKFSPYHNNSVCGGMAVRPCDASLQSLDHSYFNLAYLVILWGYCLRFYSGLQLRWDDFNKWLWFTALLGAAFNAWYVAIVAVSLSVLRSSVSLTTFVLWCISRIGDLQIERRIIKALIDYSSPRSALAYAVKLDATDFAFESLRMFRNCTLAATGLVTVAVIVQLYFYNRAVTKGANDATAAFTDAVKCETEVKRVALAVRKANVEEVGRANLLRESLELKKQEIEVLTKELDLMVDDGENENNAIDSALGISPELNHKLVVESVEKVKPTPSWSAVSVPTTAPTTVNILSVPNVIKKSMAWITVTGHGVVRRSSYGLVVSNGKVIVPKHLFLTTSDVTVSSPAILEKGLTFDVSYVLGSYCVDVKATVGVNLSFLGDKDLAMLHIVEAVVPNETCLQLFLPNPLESPSAYSHGYYYDARTSKLIPTALDLARFSHGFAIKHYAPTYDGDCLSPVLAMYGDTNLRIVGVHNGANLAYGIATVVSRQDYDNLLRGATYCQSGLFRDDDVLCPLYGMVSKDTHSKPFDFVPLDPYPVKSEFYHGVKNGHSAYIPLGTVRFQPHNAKFKSTIKKVDCYEAIVDMARRYGEEPKWTTPIYRAGMRGDDWDSPYQKKIAASHNHFIPEDKLLKAADVLFNRFAVCDVSTLRIKTIDEVIKGNEIPFCVNFSKPLDLSTSTGPPFNTKKSQFFVHGDGYSLVDDKILSNYRNIMDVLIGSPNCIPLITVNASLKDEVISETKAAEGKIRVFWIPCVEYLMLQRTVLGSFVDFCTANGSRVGISIGKNLNDCHTLDEFISRLRAVAPDFADACCLTAGDMQSQDDVDNIRLCMAVGEVVYKLHKLNPSLSPEELELVRRVIVGSIISLRFLKGDLAMVVGGNVSGQLITAVLNCLINLIVHIYAFVNDPRSADMEFYNEVAPNVLGDDSLNAVSKNIRDWYDQPHLAKVFAECGIVYTSCRKEIEFSNRLEPLSAVVYLQFQFLIIDDQWRACLSLKSVFKALLFWEPKATVPKDSLINSTIYNMLLAVYYRGERFFEQFSADLRELYPNCPVFVPYGVLALREVEYGTIFLSGESELPVSELPADMRLQSKDGPDSFEIDNHGSDPTVADKPLPHPYVHAIKAEAIFKEWTFVSSITLRDTDAVDGNVGVPLNPIYSYFTDSLIADRMRGFYTWSGGFEVLIRVSAPITTYGCYIVSWLPQPITTSGFSNRYVPHINTLVQGDCIWINPAMENRTEFTLPYFSLLRTSQVAGAGGVDAYWEVIVKCLVPLTDTLASTATGSLEFYIRPASDFRFESVILQSGHFKKNKPLSSTTGLLANVTAMVGSAVPTTAAYMAPISAGLSAVSAVASALGYSRKQEKEPFTPMVIKRGPDLYNCDGAIRDVRNVSLFNNAVTVEDEYLTAAGKDMEFPELFARETIVHRQSWLGTDARLKVLSVIPVTPMIASVVGTEQVTLTPAGYIGNLFTYWRGTMRYRVTAICSNFHSGKLMLVWSAGFQTPGSTLTLDPTNLAPTVTMDINQDVSAEVEIGWFSEQNAMICQYAKANPALGTFYSNGYLLLVVASKLVSTQATPSIKLIVTASAGPDMSFGIFRMYDTHRDIPLDAGWEDEIMLQGIETSSSSVSSRVKLGGLVGDLRFGQIQFSEQVLSVKALIQKWSLLAWEIPLSGVMAAGMTTSVVLSYPRCPYGHVSSTSPVATSWPVPVAINLETNVITSSTSSSGSPFNIVAYLSAMFTGMRGSMLYYPVLYSAVSASLVLSAVRVNPVFIAGNPTFQCVPNAGVELWHQQGLASKVLFTQSASSTDCTDVFRVPFSSIYLFDQCYGVFSAGSHLDETAVEIQFIVSNASAGANTLDGKDVYLATFMCCGDDTSLIKYRYTPVLKTDLV